MELTSALPLPAFPLAERLERLPVTDPLCFEEVFRAQAPYVLRALRYLGVPPSDLEDVAQEVFLVVHRKLTGFEGRSQLRTWLYGILVRVAADHRKRAWVRRERPTEEPPERIDDGEANRSEASDLLRHLLDQLDPPRREVVVLYEVEGFSMPEVAALLEIPVQTAYSRLKSAHERLNAGLAAHDRESA